MGWKAAAGQGKTVERAVERPRESGGRSRKGSENAVEVQGKAVGGHGKAASHPHRRTAHHPIPTKGDGTAATGVVAVQPAEHPAWERGGRAGQRPLQPHVGEQVAWFGFALAHQLEVQLRKTHTRVLL